MEVVRRRLTVAGVIGGIVDDFYPQCKLDVIYGNNRISLGDHVSPDQVQHRPCNFEYRYHPAQPEVLETFRNPTLIIVVMTGPDDVGGEYLYWLSTHVITDQHIIEMEDLVTYEAPRAIPLETPKIVFTLFRASAPHIMIPIMVPEWRNNFSTRDFAYINAYGPPLTAAFFRIIDPLVAAFFRIEYDWNGNQRFTRI